ncbi:MAG: hypothetical protein J7L64_04385 [Acidobacteria bacterium]|nr:hypothetical protein [Acidobacteriota bacterium]
MKEKLILRNEDITEVIIGIPEDHRHLRAVIKTKLGKTIIIHEASLANMVRAYITVKTHPVKKAVRLIGREITAERKGEYAHYQLLEEEGSNDLPGLLAGYLEEDKLL